MVESRREVGVTRFRRARSGWRRLVVDLAAHGLSPPHRMDGAAAGPLQPSTSCGGSRTRLSLLPYRCGERRECRDATHVYLHDVPFADLDQRRDTGTGAAESCKARRSSGTVSPTCPTTFTSITRSTSPK